MLYVADKWKILYLLNRGIKISKNEFINPAGEKTNSKIYKDFLKQLEKIL
jgi:hypothetical protein